MHGSHRLLLTPVLLAALVSGYAAQMFWGATEAVTRFSGFAPPIREGELWRIGTSAFLHADLEHLVLNLAALLFCGIALELEIGSARFAATTLAAAAVGTLTAVALAPDTAVIGASTVVYGLMGSLAVVAHRAGRGVWRSGVGVMLVFGAVTTLVGSDISVGGHLGGAAAGLLVTWLGWGRPVSFTVLGSAAVILAGSGWVVG